MLANARHTSSLREILSYELSPVPSSLVHNDGRVRKVIKSELASVLEKGINAPALPALTDDLIVHIVDGMAFIQEIHWIQHICGRVNLHILHYDCSIAVK